MFDLKLLISVWQHVKLSEQIRPWDTLARCWDVKQPTNQPAISLGFAFYFIFGGGGGGGGGCVCDPFFFLIQP